MGVFFQSDFESGSATPEWDAKDSTPSVQGTTVRTGAFALQITSLASTVLMDVQHNFSGIAVYKGIARFTVWYRVATAPSAENTFIAANDQQSAGAPYMWWLTIDASLQLRFYDEDSVIGSPSAAIAANVWHKIEVYYDMTTVAGSHILMAWIDGTNFAGASNRNLGAGLGNFCVGGNLKAEAQTTGNWYFDSVTINDVNTGTLVNNYQAVKADDGMSVTEKIR